MTIKLHLVLHVGKIDLRGCSMYIVSGRVKMWYINRASDSSSVKLCSLPPTGVSLFGNVHICHLQVAIWKVALLESPLNMNSKMARILTTRVFCVHEEYHLIHFRHLQIYYSSPNTSAKNLDVGLQAAVPSYDARYFVYERVAKQE